MGIYHKFISAATDNTALPDTVWPNVDWNDDHLSPACLIMSWHEVQSNGDSWPDQPAALTKVWGDDRSRMIKDLRYATSSRLVTNVALAGASGAEVRIQYSLDSGATWAGYLGPAQSIAAAGLFATPWQPIPTAARIENCALQMFGINGNGVADPRLRSLFLFIR
jgi:hypothetical protein